MNATTLLAWQLLVREEDGSSAMMDGLMDQRHQSSRNWGDGSTAIESVATILKAVDSVKMPGA